MFGVYKITTRIEHNYSHRTTGPAFVHSTQDDQRIVFSTDDSVWKFQKNFETLMTWTKEKNVFNDDFWLKPNGSAVINFDSAKFTINMISY